ncbi:hypothetical protein LA080_012001 [Diaporthe eres]|uniref:Uncharacterized protein n=1 Tax=Diaporthe vaccinii TaxID=105482 RepID=A0ABR4DSZ8_9PEZI|nr:hypothetical protein LA080_012001 [Diaporthe eres]
MAPGGRPKNKEAAKSNTQEAVVEKELTWLKEVMDESQREGKEHYDTLTQADFDKLKRNRDSILPDFWSDEDEAQVQAQWNKERAQRPCKKASAYEQYLWKTCARFLRCLPTELIGMRYGLEYDAGQPTQNWTASFCNHLVKIIAHPIFNNSPAKIALAVKFSVCSWQRLKWDIPDLNDLFLPVLKEVAEDNDELVGAELVRDSIKEWRARWPEEDLPQWAQLLRAIVANSKKPISTAEYPHQVTTEHVGATAASLNEIRHGKLRVYHSADLFERGLRHIRGTGDLPLNYKDPVDALLAEGIIHNRRLQVLLERHPDVDDIYKHVSRPVAVRRAPKNEYADIYVESAGAGQPAQPAQPDNSKKRKRGRPQKDTPALANTLGGGGGAPGDASGATAAKKRRGRPPKNPEPVESTPEESSEESSEGSDEGTDEGTDEEGSTSPKPNAADAASLEGSESDSSSAALVPKRLRRGRASRSLDPEESDSAPQPAAQGSESGLALPRDTQGNPPSETGLSPSGLPREGGDIFDSVMSTDDGLLSRWKKTLVPESIASSGERRAVPSSPAVIFGDNDVTADYGVQMDDVDDVLQDFSGFPRQPSDDSPSEARPVTSHSQDLGQESVAHESAVEEARSASADDDTSESDGDVGPVDMGVSFPVEGLAVDHSDTVDQEEDRWPSGLNTLLNVSGVQGAQKETSWDGLD